MAARAGHGTGTLGPRVSCGSASPPPPGRPRPGVLRGMAARPHRSGSGPWRPEPVVRGAERGAAGGVGGQRAMPPPRKGRDAEARGGAPVLVLPAPAAGHRPPAEGAGHGAVGRGVCRARGARPSLVCGTGRRPRGPGHGAVGPNVCRARGVRPSLVVRHRPPAARARPWSRGAAAFVGPMGAPGPGLPAPAVRHRPPAEGARPWSHGDAAPAGPPPGPGRTGRGAHRTRAAPNRRATVRDAPSEVPRAVPDEPLGTPESRPPEGSPVTRRTALFGSTTRPRSNAPAPRRDLGPVRPETFGVRGETPRSGARVPEGRGSNRG